MFLFKNYSTFNKLDRITALILRFMNGVLKNNRSVGFITTKELNEATICLSKISERNELMK